jgi:hypothetical protein
LALDRARTISGESDTVAHVLRAGRLIGIPSDYMHWISSHNFLRELQKVISSARRRVTSSLSQSCWAAFSISLSRRPAPSILTPFDNHMNNEHETSRISPYELNELEGRSLERIFEQRA